MKNLKCYMTYGISASGKSTWAANKVKEDKAQGIKTIEVNRDNIRFTIVSPGSSWSNYKSTHSLETLVTNISKDLIKTAYESDCNVIISDTNLNPFYLSSLQSYVQNLGFEIKIIELNTSFEEALKRDNKRANGLGSSIIYQQWLRYTSQTKKMYVPDTTKPKAIIVDIDGTVADKGSRSAFEWLKVDQDTPKQFTIDMIKAISQKYDATIVFTSGRDSICRDLTLDWIKKYINPSKDFELFMRPLNDYRKDTLVKEEIFWSDIEPKYQVIGAFDDRPCVIRLWHSIKVPNVITVSDPFIEF